MKYICIHGHFYQPPRENPYTEIINQQDSAHPFNNWNEKICFECYTPNATSRLLDDKDSIVDIINNYQHISFNFGPTLLSWLRQNSTATYKAILEADRLSVAKFDGHGSAIAQVYNHIIMPLANRSDKEVQVKWSIKDFQFHFKRKPEGMWLAETAVDTETLEVLAENGIKFTVLSPYQAKEIKETYDDEFHLITKEKLNTNKPYKVQLPSGRTITIFFYNGDFAHQLSFGDMLNNGDTFFTRLKQSFDFNNGDMELFNVALDGETFGHHHANGDMALSYCINKIHHSDDVHLVNYGKFLDLYRVTTFVHIHERTAWSCAHGVERWNSNCGCRGGGEDSWHQNWRSPLREALNYLNTEADQFFREISSTYFDDPYEVLHNYIDVILDRKELFVYIFFSKYANKKLSEEDIVILTRIFELKRNCQLMFTSCGWFFTELSGIETVQILMYADRVLQIYESMRKENKIIRFFLRLLKNAKSNIKEYQDGARIYKTMVRPNRQSLTHFAIIQALHYITEDRLLNLDNRSSLIEIGNMDYCEMGYVKALEGNFILQSKITFSRRYFSFALFQISRANFIGYFNTQSQPIDNSQHHHSLQLDEAKLTNILSLLDKAKKLYKRTFTIDALLKSDRALVLNLIAHKEKTFISQELKGMYLRNYSLAIKYLHSETKLPFYLWTVVQNYLNEQLSENLSIKQYDFKRLKKTVEEVIRWNLDITRQKKELSLSCSYLFSHLFSLFYHNDDYTETQVRGLENLIVLLRPLDLNIDLRSSQNSFFLTLLKHKRIFLNLKDQSPSLYTSLSSIALFLNIDINYVLQD